MSQVQKVGGGNQKQLSGATAGRQRPQTRKAERSRPFRALTDIPEVNVEYLVALGEVLDHRDQFGCWIIHALRRGAAAKVEAVVRTIDQPAETLEALYRNA